MTFIDYYEVLQISPNADQEMIGRVYRMLAQRYHPDNQETGDEETFKLVLDAHRTLSDPERRAAYDVEHSQARKLWWRIFDQPKTTRGIEAERRKRRGILSLLYVKRMYGGEQPSLTIKELEELLGCPREHLEFSLWFLRENQHIQRGDNGRYLITAKGVEAAEAAGDVAVQPVKLLPGPEDSIIPAGMGSSWTAHAPGTMPSA